MAKAFVGSVSLSPNQIIQDATMTKTALAAGPEAVIKEYATAAWDLERGTCTQYRRQALL